ncbi:hypothetical protein [Streptomyces griseorubiginosus]|uniref:hypothetical protein n=1 Tax=Streptomyces griseorubiginosus TaxID=67304 RepID=UPI002E80FD38|nr:hypothetical protein [Streptomyces griseorubiginosus]WUB45294.1 hypothetical protein OHN19_18865 [Streptomyces griseorubiginosus]WUB53811.1 hypothetical protein OG942_18860 [Streptomyces griseorubiginosus]
MNKGTTATAPLTSQPSPADEMVGRIHAASLDKLVAAMPTAVDRAMQRTIPGKYTPELAAAVAETAISMLTGKLCPVWPTLCTDTTPGHYDHFNHQHKVTDKRGQTLLDLSFVQLSDEDGDSPAKVCLGGMVSEDYAPSEVREATAKIRRLLDEADDMADTVLRMQGGDVPTPSARAFSTALDHINAAFEASTNHSQTRDALRTYIDMTVDELADKSTGVQDRTEGGAQA